jgi:transposase
VAGRWGYVHVACTDTLTLFHVGGRSAADVDAGGVLPGFTGTIVRDGYAAYQHLSDATHAWCGAHYSEVCVMPILRRVVLVGAVFGLAISA